MAAGATERMVAGWLAGGVVGTVVGNCLVLRWRLNARSDLARPYSWGERLVVGACCLACGLAVGFLAAGMGED